MSRETSSKNVSPHSDVTLDICTGAFCSNTITRDAAQWPCEFEGPGFASYVLAQMSLPVAKEATMKMDGPLAQKHLT